jgi:hypothetical protein
VSEVFYYPEPIWSIHLTKEQIEQGACLTVKHDEIRDYRIDPLSQGWEARYKSEATVERIKALGLPKVWR